MRTIEMQSILKVLITSYILFILQKLMPPKIERYATEPKKDPKQAIRESGKMSSMTRALPRKVNEFKHFTISSKHDRIIFKDGELTTNGLTASDFKKRSFVVTKRKSNKSILQDALSKSFTKQKANQWIEKIEFQSYQGIRDYNEDRILIKQNLVIKDKEESLNLFAVFDGHGGSTASEYLRLHFVKVFEHFAEENSIEDALKKAVMELENRIIRAGMKINSGSCATILVTRENEYWAANVGDSRILIVKDLEEFVQITEDHKPENSKQYKRIQNLGGKVYRNLLLDQNTGQKSYGPFRVLPSRLSVTRAIGDFLIKKNQTQNLIIAQPEIYSGQLSEGDVILLFSDGAYEQFSNSELSILFCNKCKHSLRQRMSNFLNAAKKRNTNDNTSMIAIQVRQGKSAETSAGSTTEPSFSNLDVQ